MERRRRLEYLELELDRMWHLAQDATRQTRNVLLSPVEIRNLVRLVREELADVEQPQEEDEALSDLRSLVSHLQEAHREAPCCLGGSYNPEV